MLYKLLDFAIITLWVCGLGTVLCMLFIRLWNKHTATMEHTPAEPLYCYYWVLLFRIYVYKKDLFTKQTHIGTHLALNHITGNVTRCVPCRSQAGLTLYSTTCTYRRKRNDIQLLIEKIIVARIERGNDVYTFRNWYGVHQRRTTRL